MYKAATIFAFLFLLSCTVTKRVHRPGFHIEWKKNYKVQKEQQTERSQSVQGADFIEAGLQEPQPSDGHFDSNAEALEVRESTHQINPENNSAKSISFSQQHKRHHTQKRTQQHTSNFFVEKSRTYAPLKMPKAEKSASKRSGGFAADGFRGIGYVLLGIGIFLLLGTLMSFTGIWLLEEIFYSLVFSGNGIIAGILGFIVFLVILLVVFIAYAVVHYILGGAYIGLIVSLACIGIGALCLLIGSAI